MLKLLIVVLFLAAAILAGKHASAEYSRMDEVPGGPFRPSNAQTENGSFIPVEQFFPAARCLSCHQDTHSAWSESLHRNAAREPFYRESADILLRTRGIEFTCHCESCHTPVALFSGALRKDAPRQEAPFTALDHEGVTCSVCHSVTDAKLNGTGSFTVRRPALLAKEDGTPVFGNFTDEQILADVPGHKRAVMRPLLRSPEFCSTCHKVDAPPDLNGYKHIRGFSAYDEWQQSGASQESVLPFYPRDMRKDCRACHMPKVESLNDRAAKEGRIASHRWLGANPAAPLFYGQKKQAEMTAEFLKKDVLEVDIFALRRNATGEVIAPLNPSGQTELTPGEEVTAEIVISNRNAAHTFPPEVRDLYEAWVEFEVLDASGKTVFHSGFVKPDGQSAGMLDEAAHVYKLIILDEQARQITRHQIWTTNIKAYDNTIPPGRSDVARFRFRVPQPAVAQNRKPGRPSAGRNTIAPRNNGSGLSRSLVPTATRIQKLPPSALTLRARVNYRRLNYEYSTYVLTRQKKTLTLPIVRMAEAQVQMPLAATTRLAALLPSQAPISIPEWKRWNDYGIGLLEQAQYGEASAAFRRAAELSPADPSLLVNAAIAELRTERYAYHDRPQLQKAAELIERALRIPGSEQFAKSSLLRARYYRALVWRADGKLKEAAAELEQIAEAYPRDREVQRQLAQTRYTLGRFMESRLGFEAILGVDPTDFAAYQFLSPLYLSEGRKSDADRANALYLQWRDDPRADAIAAKFFAAHPEWADERIGAHVHDIRSTQRAILTGPQAVPDK
jgi:tetratricopeptide (TPR) repeat protein